MSRFRYMRRFAQISNFIRVKKQFNHRMEPLNIHLSQHEKNDEKLTINDRNSKIITVCDQRLEGTDNKYYKDGANYWSSVDPSVDGMLGGFGNISNIDIEGSAKFLKGIYKV